MNKFKPHIYPPKQPLPLPPPTATRSFNSTINRLSSEGAHEDVLFTYSSMLAITTPPDAYTFPRLLKACTALNMLSHGLSVHQHIIVTGYSSNAYIASCLINFYAKFGCTHNARQVFEMMQERNVISWTTMIGCYSRAGDAETAFCLYNQMRYEGIQPSSVTLLGILSGMLEVTLVQYVHSATIKYGFDSDIALVNNISYKYGKCRRVEDARDLFELTDRKNIVSWNTLVSSYALVGNVGEILHLMSRMRIEGLDPDQQTVGSLAFATARQSDPQMGPLVHSQILTSGFESDGKIETSLTVMYLKCGNFDYAFKIFERNLDKHVILWTAMISGLVQNECADKALALFQRMMLSSVTPSTATIASVLAACGQLGSLTLGTSIHAYMLRQKIPLDVFAENSLIAMYAKCGRVDQCNVVFYSMEKRDVASWNAIVAGYAQNCSLDKSLSLFNEMRISFQRPDSITVVSLLQVCASIGALHLGKWMHNFALRNCLVPCILIETALVNMYSKCGDLNTARKCFDRISQHNVVSWNTIIAGYGCHGKGEIALDMYNKFLLTGLQPNHAIFLSVLSACSHTGLVNSGFNIFFSMKEDYRVEPKLEHLSCIVDLLSRAGRVEDAYDFYKRMFTEPTIDVLGILLDACRTSGNLQLRQTIAGDMLKLKPSDSGQYLQLAHSYASMDRWDWASEARSQMKNLGLKKLPGWSFIELNGMLTTFFSQHNSHPQQEDIVHVLKFLSEESRDLGTGFKTNKTP